MNVKKEKSTRLRHKNIYLYIVNTLENQFIIFLYYNVWVSGIYRLKILKRLWLVTNLLQSNMFTAQLLYYDSMFFLFHILTGHNCLNLINLNKNKQSTIYLKKLSISYNSLPLTTLIRFLNHIRCNFNKRFQFSAF